LLQESLQQKGLDDSLLDSEDYQALIDSNHLLAQQLEEFKSTAVHANEARLKAENGKKAALDQLHMLRQEAEIQREDLRSAEMETKKAWKIVAEANSKTSAQAKELKEAHEAKFELTAKMGVLQRNLDELNASSKLGNVEKSRLETEILSLQRRLKMEQELTKRAEADLASKTRELAASKYSETEQTKVKLAAISEQKEKLEGSLKDWQTKHANVASRLAASEAQKSRAVLEIEDLVVFIIAF
jgi:chromosome segregation ATPase